MLEEAEFYNITELIRLVKERIILRDARPLRDSEKYVYRVIQCHEDELTQMISTLSDGWKFEQVSLVVRSIKYLRSISLVHDVLFYEQSFDA